MTPPGYRRQWRWYRAPGSERSVAREEFAALPRHGQAALIELMQRWARGGPILAHEVKPLAGSGGLKELRVNVGSDPFRVIFFADSPVHDVIVVAIYKNQKKLPKGDIERAQKRRATWESAGRGDRGAT